jgi:hypothetical protein
MLAVSLAGTVAAAPVLSSIAEVKSAAATKAIDARWRRWGSRRGYRSYFIGSAYGYARYSNSGCHVEGGYYRPRGAGERIQVRPLYRRGQRQKLSKDRN